MLKFENENEKFTSKVACVCGEKCKFVKFNCMEIINQSSLERERENKMNNSLQVDWTPVSINWRHWMVDWLVTIFNV